MRSAHDTTVAAALAGLVLLLAGCHQIPTNREQCVACHGGDPDGQSAEVGHNGLYDLADDSGSGLWEKGCAACHRYQFERMQSSQMFTNAGMIAQNAHGLCGRSGSAQGVGSAAAAQHGYRGGDGNR